ncbi:MAG: PQQ-like beta-propeller repeat protein [Phycisphaerae bacterium]|nr:PQQ-like beta-propeller repeat protein [Phycisphaerae bacterium]
MSPRTRLLTVYDRQRSFSRLGWISVVVLVLAVGVLGGRWYLSKHSLDGHVRRGLELLAQADSPREIRAALEIWENETRPAWQPRTDELVTHLYSNYPLEDQNARRLLTYVSGADYGDRHADWRRWYETRRRLREGLPPRVSRNERVKLEFRWTAPVGLTAWFTTIIPLDGQIYVASLGARFDDARDIADGVVRVDGATGQSELLFSPPDRPGRGPRDVVGIAAGDDCLFVGCLNGTVYCITPDGQTQWNTHVGSPVVGPPLAVDFNRDELTDVIVATRAGKVVALSGRTGRTAWVSDVARPPAGASMLGVTLALADVQPGHGTELVVTTPRGVVEVLAVRNGRSGWRREFAAGTVAGAVCRGGALEHGLPAFVGDRAARVWALMNSGQTLEAVPWSVPALRREETLIAGLRTLREPPEGAPLLLACPTGDYAGRRGGVCVLSPTGVQWRFPVGGAVWGTPAVADLNGDRVPEIVVTSIEAAADERVIGVVTVVSQAGHGLARQVLESPVECSPVIADVDGDEHLEVLVADQSGRLHCFGTGRRGPVKWGLFGGDSHNTRNADNAFSYGQVPFGYQWRWREEK